MLAVLCGLLELQASLIRTQPGPVGSIPPTQHLQRLSVQTRRLGTETKSALWDMRGLHPESDELWMHDWWGGRTRRSWKIFLLSPLQINPPSLKPECGRWVQITISILGKFSLRAQRPAFSRAHVFCASNRGREGKKKANKLAFGLAASCSGWPITQLSLAVILQILGYVCVREWQRRLSAPET